MYLNEVQCILVCNGETIKKKYWATNKKVNWASSYRTGNRNHLRNLVFNHCPSGVTISGHNIENAFWQKLARNLGEQKRRGGVVSDGFRTMVFPAAIAGANFQTAMFSG